jgi:hypothetical protein
MNMRRKWRKTFETFGRNTPAEAVAWFFAFMPPGWNAEAQEMQAMLAA